jgi:hypothetical protein
MTKKRIARLCCFLLPAALSACCSDTPLDKRWDKLADPAFVQEQPGSAYAPSLWVAAVPAAAPAGTSPKDLADRTGASYFRELGRFSKSSAEFIQLAGKPLGAAGGRIDTTSFSRTLVITVSRPRLRVGDRLVRTRIVVTPENFRFSNYTIAATAYSTVNIDSINTSKTTAFGAELDPTFAGGLVGAGKLSASSSRTVTDAAQVSQQIEQLTVAIEGQSLVIYRESERGLDLTGATLIKLSLQVKDPADSGEVDHQYLVSGQSLFNDDKALTQDKASISISEAAITRPVDFKALATLEYVSRHIVSGADTYQESDDEVQFLTSPNPPPKQEFPLILAREMALPRWTVYSRDMSNVFYVGSRVGSRQLVFSDYEAAQQFAHWLSLTRAVAIGNNELFIAPRGDTMTEHRKPMSGLKAYPELVVERCD